MEVDLEPIAEVPAKLLLFFCGAFANNVIDVDCLKLQPVLLQTGQNVQVIALVMGTYLSFSLLISLVMNFVNKRMEIVER